MWMESDSILLVTMLVLAAVVGGYVVTSYLLLRYPTILHQRKKLKFKAIHISHRGGAGEKTENTMEAFHHAAKLGTDMFELDCHITKDGHVVVSHDNNLVRTTGREVIIGNSLYQDLPALKADIPLDFAWHHRTIGSKDRTIPLLKDVFQTFPNTPVNIDIKIDNDDLIRKVSELVREYGREQLTVWGSRSYQVTNKCFAENPDILLLFSMRRVLTLVLCYYTGLLPFLPLRESCYEIVMPSILLGEGAFNTTFSSRAKLLFRIFDFLLMSPGMFRHLSARGIQTYLWVLNEERDFDRAFRIGATGVMTDFPTKLRHFLSDHRDYVTEK